MRATAARLATLLVALGVALGAAPGIATPVAAGEYYKWIDGEGVVHFTRQPPQGRQAEVVETPDGVAAPSEPPDPVDEAQREGRGQAEEKLERQRREQQRVEAERAAMRRHNCQWARERLQFMTTNNQINIRSEDGSSRTIGEDERQRRMQRLRRVIAESCGGGG